MEQTKKVVKGIHPKNSPDELCTRLYRITSLDLNWSRNKQQEDISIHSD